MVAFGTPSTATPRPVAPRSSLAQDFADLNLRPVVFSSASPGSEQQSDDGRMTAPDRHVRALAPVPYRTGESPCPKRRAPAVRDAACTSGSRVEAGRAIDDMSPLPSDRRV